MGRKVYIMPFSSFPSPLNNGRGPMRYIETKRSKTSVIRKNGYR